LLPMPLPGYSPGRSNALAEPHIASTLNLKPGDRSIKATVRARRIRRATSPAFISTVSPFSARILGANSEPRYDSRLYLAFVAKMATAGGPPDTTIQREIDLRERHRTIGAFQSLGY
jgi:hypothetical protein